MQTFQTGPIITLTTDFGLSDHYVGTMKGVILSRCPDARIIDISHQVPAFSVMAGAYTIDQAARYFPRSTTHLVVIDPGVGTSRKAILVRALEQTFIAPDNGVLSLIVSRDPAATFREISNHELFLEPVSDTFHGRDVFAPAAASLAGGLVKCRDVGPALSSIEVFSGLKPVSNASGGWTGMVLSADHFGNLITNFECTQFSDTVANGFELTINNCRISAFQRTFGNASPGTRFVYCGSSGFLEIGVNRGSAAADVGGGSGSAVTLRTLSSHA